MVARGDPLNHQGRQAASCSQAPLLARLLYNSRRCRAASEVSYGRGRDRNRSHRRDGLLFPAASLCALPFLLFRGSSSRFLRLFCFQQVCRRLLATGATVSNAASWARPAWEAPVRGQEKEHCTSCQQRFRLSLVSRGAQSGCALAAMRQRSLAVLYCLPARWCCCCTRLAVRKNGARRSQGRHSFRFFSLPFRGRPASSLPAKAAAPPHARPQTSRQRQLFENQAKERALLTALRHLFLAAPRGLPAVPQERRPAVAARL